MDVSSNMSVKTGSIETDSLSLEDQHNGPTSQETDVMKHKKWLITEAGTDHSGEVQGTGAGCLKTELKNNIVACGLENCDRKRDSAENIASTEGVDNVVSAKDNFSLAASTSVDGVVSAKDNFSLAASTSVDGVVSAKENFSLAASTSVDGVVSAEDSFSLAASTSVDNVVSAKDNFSLAASTSVDGVVSAKDSFSLAASTSVDGVVSAEDSFSLAGSTSVDGVVSAEDSFSLAGSTSVDGVNHQLWPSEDVSKVQNKLLIRDVADDARNVEITGQNCDILGNSSIEVDCSKTESSLSVLLSADVNICAEVNVSKATCNGDVYLEEESIKHEIGQQDNCTSESPPLVHWSANEDANNLSGKSLTKSESACNVTDIPVDTGATYNGGDDLMGTEDSKQERNPKESGDLTFQDNICHAGTELTCNNAYLSDKDTFKQDNVGTDDRVNKCVNESLPSVPSADKDSAMDSACLPSVSCDCDVNKETSELVGNLQVVLQNNVQIDESPSLDLSAAHKCAKNISYNDLQVNVEINGGMSLDPSATQGIGKMTSLDPTLSQEETQIVGRYESDVSALSLDNDVCEAGRGTSEQEIFQENGVKTITSVHRSSSLVHVDKGENWQSGEGCTAEDIFDDSLPFVENDTLKQEISMKTATYFSRRSSSLVPLDNTRDENRIPEGNFEDNVSFVESEALAPADDQQNVQIGRCLNSSPVPLNSDKITAMLKCDEKGLSQDRFCDQNCPVDGESYRIQELFNQGIKRVSSDLQSTAFMKHENSATLDEEDNFKKQDVMDSDNQKILTDPIQKESCSAGVDLDISESPMTVNKTVHSASLDSDLSEIQMTSIEVVHCRSVADIPESLITSGKTVQSVSIGVSEPEPLETVTKTVHSDSLTKGELEILTEGDLRVFSDSSGEGELEVMAEGSLTVHSDSSEEIELEVLPEGKMTVHSDSSEEIEREILPEGKMTVQSDSSEEIELEVLPKGKMTVHSDSSEEIEREVLPEGKMTVHSDSSEEIEQEILPEGKMTVQSDSSEEIELEVLPEGKMTVHSDSSEEIEREVLPEGKMTVHSDSSEEIEREILPEGKMTVHSDSSEEIEREILPEGKMTVHSDSSEEIEREILLEGKMTVHSDSSEEIEREILPEGKMTVHSDSSEEIELEVLPEGKMTVQSDSSSVRARKTEQSAADETESPKSVRKTVYSDSSSKDVTGQFCKTIPFRGKNEGTHKSLTIVDMAAHSEGDGNKQSESQEIFNETPLFENAGGGKCVSLKKNNNKAMSKKKKKMKEKKGHRKKSKRKQKSEQVAESLRLVEVSGDKYGAEELRMEETEADGVICNKLCKERMLVVAEEDLLHREGSNQQVGDLKEPGELEFIKERRKKAKKKKKRRRRVATVEEGDVGDNASQKFPTYLDGFFLHYSDRNEELGEIVDDASVSFHIQPGMLDKDDRIHHGHFSYESVDSVKSDNCSERVRNRDEEVEGRRRRRHDKREHKERKRKQKDRSHSYEALYEREHPSVTVCSSREYTFNNERYRNERHEERVRSSERKIRRIDREHISAAVLPDQDRRNVQIEEVRRHTARSSPHDSRTVIAVRSPVHSNQQKRRSQSRGVTAKVRSPVHSNQHRRRSESRGVTAEAEQERRLERAKHKDQHNTGRISHKRDRHAERNHRSERNSDKENNRSYKRRRQMRTQESNGSDYRGRNRNARRVRRRGGSTSSSSSAGSDVRRRYDDSDGGHCVVISLGSSDDDGASSDVILVESEKIVINLDDEEDPPSGVRFTSRRNRPANARKTNEPPPSRNINEPVTARKAHEPAIARKTNEPAISRNISEAAIARKANEPAIAKKTNGTAIARDINEPAVARKTNEPAIARTTNEPATARKTKDSAVSRNINEPAVKKKTNERAVKNKTNEPAVARKTNEPTSAREADEPAIAKKGVRPAIAMIGTKSAFAMKTNKSTIAKKVTEPVIARKTDKPVSARKSKNVRPPLAQSASLSRSVQICGSPRRLEDVRDVSERQECNTTPVSAKQAIEVESLPSIIVSAVYDPMFPTEEEEYNFRHKALHPSTLSTSPVGQRPPSPDYPAPEDGRPYTPPLPVVNSSISSLLYSFQPNPEAANSHLTLPPENRTLISPQQQASLPLPRQFGTEFEQSTVCPKAVISPNKQFPNGCLTPRHSSAQQSPVPTQDTAPALTSEICRMSVLSVPFLLPPPPPPFGVCLDLAEYLPVSAVGQVSQPASPQPLMDRLNMASCRDESFEMCSNQQALVSTPQPALTETSPLVGSLAADLTSSCSHSSQGHDDGDMDARNTLDFSSEDDDDYHLELLSPKASSKKDLKQRKQRRQHSDLNHDVSTGNGGNPSSTSEGSVKPGKTLSKDANKLVPKETLQATSDRSKVHHGKKKIVENSVPEEDDDVPASAADLTCKEKFMKKLYFQERVIEEVKMAVKPFYISKKITKEQYKVILRKAVPKVCHNRKGNINPQKILQLVEAYVKRMIKGAAGRGGKKQHRAGERHNPKDKNMSASVKHSGDRLYESYTMKKVGASLA